MATVLAVKRKHTNETSLDWTGSRRQIARLYLEEDRALSIVMKIMREDHDLDASKAQYEAQFKFWGFRKYWTPSHWRYAYFKSKERREAGKDSLVFLNCTPVSETKLKKEIRRCVTAAEQSMPVSSLVSFLRSSLPECPEGLSVCTPPELALRGLRVDNLPWIEFKGLIGSNLRPSNFGFDLEEIARAFPLIDETPPSPSLPSFGMEAVGHTDDLTIPGDLLLSLVPRSPSPERMTSQIRRPALASYGLEPLQLMLSTLERYGPQPSSKRVTSGGEAEWTSLLELSHPDPIIHLLKMFVYLCSNNMVHMSWRKDDYHFFDYIVDNFPTPLLDALLSAKIPTTEACIEHLFAHALERRNVELVRCILAKDKDILETSTFGEFYEEVVLLDELDIVRFFLEARDDAPQIAPLWNAQSPKMVRYLLNAGANIDTLYQIGDSLVPDNTGTLATALFVATCYGRIDIVQTLIEKKADVNIPAEVTEYDLDDSRDHTVTPFSAAVDREVRSLQGCGEEQEYDDDSFHLLRILLEAGADVNACSRSTRWESGSHKNPIATPLQVACGVGHHSLSNLLLSHGANVNAPADSDGNTALQSAVKTGNVVLAKLLLEHGADLDAFDRHEEKPGRSCRAVTVVKLLLEMRATSGYTGIKNRDLATVRELLEWGIKADAPSRVEPGCLGECLFAAVARGDIEVAEMLLHAGADCTSEAVDPSGMSAIEIAETIMTAKTYLEMVHLLKKFGATPSKQAERKALLLAAIGNRDYSTVRSILDSGIRFTESDRIGSKVFVAAAESEAKNLLIRLIQAGLNIRDPFELDFLRISRPMDFLGKVPKSITPLGYVIVHHSLNATKRFAMMSAILDTGLVDPNASVWNQSESNQPPLHLIVELWVDSVRESDLFNIIGIDIIRLLLNRGACADGRGIAFGYSSCTSLLQLLAESSSDQSWPAKLQVAELLLQRGAKVDTTGPDDFCYPLQAAASNGNLDLVRLFLKYNANINAPATWFDETPLQVAIKSLGFYTTSHGDTGWERTLVNIIDLLLVQGANVSEPPPYKGQTALQYAVLRENFHLVTRLIDLGADVNAPDTDGNTAIIFAARSGLLEMVHLLIDKGANVNAAGDDDNTYGTALEAAARMGRLDVVQLLINAGADTHLPGSKRYRSAERKAQSYGRMAIARLLRSHFEDGTWG